MATKRTRLTTDQKLETLALIARGDTLSQVVAYLLEKYDIKISESALSQLKKNHKDSLEKMEESMLEAQATDAEALLHRSRRMLNHKLERAERDGKQLEELDRQWREGEIKNVESYRQRKAGLMKVSIAELALISKTMFVQAHPEQIPNKDQPTLPPGTGHSSTPAQLEAMLKAIAAGNTVELQRLIFSPGKKPDDIPVTV